MLCWVNTMVASPPGRCDGSCGVVSLMIKSVVYSCVNPLGPKLLTKFTPRGITADNYAPTACSAAR